MVVKTFSTAKVEKAFDFSQQGNTFTINLMMVEFTLASMTMNWSAQQHDLPIEECRYH